MHGVAFRLAVATIGVACALTAPSARASREDGAPAAALGLADTVRGGGVGTSALFFNPAGMSTLRQYSLEAGYSLLSNTLDGHAFGIAAVDSATNQNMAMGLAYNYITSKLGGVDRDGHAVRAGLSSGYGTQDFHIAVGVGGRYLSLQNGDEDNGNNGEVDDVEFLTVDVGLVLQIGSILRLGVVGQNLIDTKAVGEAPRKVGFGAAARFGGLELAFDTELDLQSVVDETPATFSFGAQYFFAQGVVARTGFVQDALLEQQRFAIGASYVSREVGVDLGYSRALSDEGDSVFSASFKYFLP